MRLIVDHLALDALQHCTALWTLEFRRIGQLACTCHTQTGVTAADVACVDGSVNADTAHRLARPRAGLVLNGCRDRRLDGLD